MPIDLWKKEQAQELYARGYTIRQIADRIHTQYGTAKRYVDPEYDELLRQRGRETKNRYRGTCEICGKPTSYSGKQTQGSRRCIKHAAMGRKVWTREKIIAAIQKWAEIYGRPPSSVDWNASLAKQERGPEYPAAGSVYGDHGAFATWADAIEAAGFPRPKTTYSGRHGELVWTKENILDALRMWADDGVAPRQTDWDRRGPGRPTSTWVAKQFGSWSKACHEAGLLTYKEAYYHGRDGKETPASEIRWTTDDQQALNDERLAFVRRVMDDHVPRRFLAQQLWQPWGFQKASSLAYWLTKNGIDEFPGYHFQPKRQLTREELEEAHTLTPDQWHPTRKVEYSYR